MLLCLCNDVCKRSLAIYCMSRTSYLGSRLLSVPIIQAAYAEQGLNKSQTKQNRSTQVTLIEIHMYLSIQLLVAMKINDFYY